MIEKAFTDLQAGRDCDVVETGQVGVGADTGSTVLGDGAVIRGGTILYGDVRASDRFATGHHEVVSLPVHPALADEQVDRVAAAVLEYERP